MSGKIEEGGSSQGRQKKNERQSSQDHSSSQYSSSKRGRSDQTKFISNDRAKRKKSRPPTEKALQLSDQLKKLSREKKLDEALIVFWDSSNSKIRDGYHACIMVDMAARCGNIAASHLLVSLILVKTVQKSYLHENQRLTTNVHHSHIAPLIHHISRKENYCWRK